MIQRSQTYDQGTQLFHWASAVLILGMIPLGFLMQHAAGAVKLSLYRAHALTGSVVLLLTVVRIVWVVTHASPEPLPISRLHSTGMKGIHVLLYAVLLIMTASGLAMMALSTLPNVLKGVATTFPDLSKLPARKVHGVGARIYVALLAAHVGGVLRYQFVEGDIFSRMGVTLFGKHVDLEGKLK
jgi:cytochrome b561